MLKVWFIDFFTEAHRRRNEGEHLVRLLSRYGVECVETLDDSVDLILNGTVWNIEKCNAGVVRCPKPVVHYNWDIYPFQLGEVEGYERIKGECWPPFLESLRTCRKILVPSACTQDRTFQYTDRRSVVCKTSIRPWNAPCKIEDHGYIVNVMRKYPDPNREAVEDLCRELGIPVVSTGAEAKWEDFQRIICRAKFLVSPYYEASTGGLTLLEGYWHGKPCLLSNSPRMGAIDYMGDRGTYFQWNDRDDLAEKLVRMYKNTPEVDVAEAREWIIQEYSEESFAKRLANELRTAYEQQDS